MDPRLARLRGRLLSEHGGEAVDETPDLSIDRMEAAVALIVRTRPELDVLLIKRATAEGDRWSGQMALPGGRYDRTDTGLLMTAKREAMEETGVDLERDGSVLARLQDVSPSSPLLPPLRVAPFVFGVPAGTEARVASPEVDTVHWVRISELANPATSSSTRIHFKGFSKVFPSYEVVGEHVWGLTYRILSDFLSRYPAS